MIKSSYYIALRICAVAKKMDSLYQKKILVLFRYKLWHSYFKPWFRGIKKLLKVQDNFDQTCACFINICSATEGKEGALLNYCISRVLSNCLPQNVLILGGDFNCTIYYAKDRNRLRVSSSICKRIVLSYTFMI